MRDTVLKMLMMSGGFSGFTPTQASNLEFWGAVRDDNSLTLVGSNIDVMGDKSGNARHATAHTSNSRALYTASGINGLPSADFDASGAGFNDDSYLMASPCPYASGNVVVAVFQVGDLAEKRIIVGGSLFFAPTVIVETNGTIGVYRGTVLIGTTTATVSVGQDVILGVKLLNGNVTVEINGYVEVLSTAALTFSNGIDEIGDPGNNSGEHYDGLLSELLIYDGDVSETYYRSLMAYLEDLYAVGYSRLLAANESANVLLLGASITNGLGDTLVASAINTLYGSSVTVVNAATSGWTTSNLQANIDSIIAANPSATHAILHIGGNNVSAAYSAHRGYYSDLDSALDTWDSDITYILDALDTAGIEVIPMDLTFRDYGDTTITNEHQGSLPYNDWIVNPTYYARYPEYYHAKANPADDNEIPIPHGQYYQAVKNNYDTWLQADNIHMTSTGSQGLRDFIASHAMCKLLTGYAPEKVVGTVTRYYREAAVASPTSITDIATPAVYCHADTSVLTLDTGLLAQISDLSGNGNHLTQSNAAKRYAVLTDAYGNYLNGTGGGNALDRADQWLEFTTPITLRTMFLVADINLAGDTFNGVVGCDIAESPRSHILITPKAATVYGCSLDGSSAPDYGRLYVDGVLKGSGGNVASYADIVSGYAVYCFRYGTYAPAKSYTTFGTAASTYANSYAINGKIKAFAGFAEDLTDVQIEQISTLLAVS